MIATAREAAQIIGCAYSTVTLHCRKMGVERYGRDYFLDDEQIRELRERIRTRRGRPTDQERGKR